ncbi:bifunctional P-loop containing nucleoside triphosphate hydrolase/SMCs flexible hinge/DNA-directed RNA polymerase III subunit RPC4/RecF-RecN-SMC [Babesia duncani]|uniref:Structural maintenance of chromosomes protein n=1 Tax=Babesia duncani TaxID=323732 RepID=A0AAD9PI89_9APIC|nr:bifunctional P-loop containing nucleoside triphosphate hydrolase/SMCs flexible hinge/DNA-directed RNA polymerase III subunit RPC4/RecF-RecN-SMC [Babesia duncani]
MAPNANVAKVIRTGNKLPEPSQVKNGQLHVESLNSLDSTVHNAKKSKSKKIEDHVRKIGADIRNMNMPIRRLIISKVVLRNFKSYGGTTVIGPFHKKFTSIVGPNGSGKSNVIDAMLFVFGFRAKQMRFEKLSELIHNSNAYIRLNKGRPLESMEVSVHFCEILDHDPDSDGFEVIEGSELVISREVFRDNTSRYRINGSNSTQKQVSNALKSFGMDLYNNRFLILQGEVEQIAQMKPKATKPDEEGLLEYLEDIIGTNQYLEKINEAQQVFEKHQDEYQERSNRTRAAQKEVEDLMEQKKLADEYCKKENHLYKTMITLTQKTIFDTNEKRTVLVRELDQLKDLIKQANSKLECIQEEKNVSTEKLKLAEIELDKAMKSQKQCQDTLQKMCNKDEDLRKQLLREVERVEEKTRYIKKANDTRPMYEQGVKEKLAKAEEILKTIPGLQAELDRAEAALDELTEKLKPEMDAAQRTLEESESMLAPIQQSYDHINKEISILEGSIKLIEYRKMEANFTLESLKEKEIMLQKGIQTNKHLVIERESNLKNLQGDLQQTIGKISELEATINQKTRICMQRKGEYESMKREFQEIAGSRDQYNYIMNMVSSGKLKGIHGRLGDLGSTMPEYETAFMAAGGGHVDVLIVDSPDVASKIFDELRKNNLGRCSAMALSVLNNDLKNRMEANERMTLQSYPHGTLKLMDLIQPNDPMYKICFYYAVRDTLVAKNLNDASIIGYQHRKRVVTLQGELIEPDGRMCGGGISKKPGSGLRKRQPNNSGLSKIPDVKDLEALKKEMEVNMAELDKLEKQLQDYNKCRYSLEKNINDLKHNIHVLYQTIENDEIQLREQLERQSELAAQSDTNEDLKLVQLKAELNSKIKDREHINEQVKMYESQVANAYKIQEQVGKGKVKAAKVNVSNAEKKLTNLRKEVDTLRKRAAELQCDAEKCNRDIAKFEKEISQHKRREVELEKQLDHLEEEASQTNEQVINANKILKESQNAVKGLEEIIANHNKVIEQYSLKSLDLKHKLDELDANLEAADKVISRHQDELVELKTKYNNSLDMIQKSSEADALLNPTTEVCALMDHDELQNIIKNELVDLDANVLEKEIEQIKGYLENVPNLSVIETFIQKATEYKKKKTELQEVQERRDEAKRVHDDLSTRRKTEFLSNFAIIAGKLKQMYQTITLGGDAELELVDSTDPFAEGILFSVRPAKKSWKQIQNLSGGEKTLSSLALVFALHHYKPNPVYFMDEIDAALDFRNVSIIAQNIKERTKDAQFIIISLRNQMFELCNQMGLFDDDDSTVGIENDRNAIPIKQSVEWANEQIATEDFYDLQNAIDLASPRAMEKLEESCPNELLPSILPSSRENSKDPISIFNTPGRHLLHIQMPLELPELIQPEQPRDPETMYKYSTSLLSHLPSGRLARLRMHASGKCSMLLGEHEFTLKPGNSISCKQQVGCFLKENNEFLFLGNYNKKFVICPNMLQMNKRTE